MSVIRLKGEFEIEFWEDDVDFPSIHRRPFITFANRDDYPMGEILFKYKMSDEPKDHWFFKCPISKTDTGNTFQIVERIAQNYKENLIEYACSKEKQPTKGEQLNV